MLSGLSKVVGWKGFVGTAISWLIIIFLLLFIFTIIFGGFSYALLALIATYILSTVLKPFVGAYSLPIALALSLTAIYFLRKLRILL